MQHWPVIDDRQDVRAYARIITHPFLQDNLPLLADLLDRSLRAHRGEYPLIPLQFDLLKAILEAMDALRMYRRYRQLVARAQSSLVTVGRIERVKAAQRRLVDLQQCEQAAEWFLHGLRSIEHNGGLDNWLLKTSATLLSADALKLKRAITKKRTAAAA